MIFENVGIHLQQVADEHLRLQDLERARRTPPRTDGHEAAVSVHLDLHERAEALPHEPAVEDADVRFVLIRRASS